MGPQEDFVETVFTCEGDINDPDLKNRLEDFRSTLKDLLSTGKADGFSSLKKYAGNI